MQRALMAGTFGALTLAMYASCADDVQTEGQSHETVVEEIDEEMLEEALETNDAEILLGEYSPELIVASLDKYLEKIVSDDELLYNVYHLVAFSRLAKTPEGTMLLLKGLKEPAPRTQRTVAAGLTRAPVLMKPTVDQALIEYITSDATSSEAAADLLGHYYNNSRHGRDVSSIMLEYLLSSICSFTDGKSYSRWAGLILLRQMEFKALLRELAACEEADSLAGILEALRVALSGTEYGKNDPLTLNEAEQELLLDSLKRLFFFESAEVRMQALALVLPVLEAVPEKNTVDQTAANIQFMKILKEMQLVVQDEKVLAYLEEYLLYAFEPDGSLKPRQVRKREFRERHRERR